MAYVAGIEDGKVVSGTAETNKAESSSKNKSMYDEEMFMKLLVAEMQYQDPLEPTSNTEYVSELAQFSQIEAMQNVQGTVDDLGAQSLAGKYVTITNSEGEAFTGMVDYVQNKDGEMYVSVNDELYSMNDITYVYSDDYYGASITAANFSKMVYSLPSKTDLTIADEDKVNAVRKFYEELTSYELSFISSDDYAKFKEIDERMTELRKAYDSAHAADSSNEADSTDKTESTDKVESTEATDDTSDATADTDVTE